MYAIFFTPNGLAIKVSIPKRKSMNTRFYRNKVLRKFVKFYQKWWPKIGICGICLYYDNASSHKAWGVASLLERTGGLCSRTFTLFPWSSPLWLFSLPSSQEKSCWQKYTSHQKLGVSILKVSKVAKIRNPYNQVPHLTQDTNGKVTNSQKTPQTRAKRSALSQQVTTKHI